MTDHRDLLGPGSDFIMWVGDFGGGKFQDLGNNFRCHASRSGAGWEVGARYGFEDGRTFIPFGTGTEALTFYANYLFTRRMRAMKGERFTSEGGLIDRRHLLVIPGEGAPEWRDVDGDAVCSEQADGRWTVSSRMGFRDGSRSVDFAEPMEAFAFMVNLLIGRRMATT